ncbi:MAG TPA: error-prone DNA polymerase [Solirubrobacterales bacterium]|jgi:error-prone DNA polymerase|nr:error-prone DNA polymerase [Solirubrobacterales bacterium]
MTRLPVASSAPRPSRRGSRQPAYVELHAHSAYSFGDGASLPEELAIAAAELGHESFALTDHDGVWGAMEFAQACEPLGVRPIVGAELTVTDTQSFHLTLLVENTTGWRNLCRLLTEAHAGTRPRPNREPLPPSLPLDSLLGQNEGLVCLSGCAREGVLASAFERGGGRPSPGEAQRARELGRRLVAAFGRDRFRVELQRPFWRRDRGRNRWLTALSEDLAVPCVATGDVHSHDRSRAELQDALVAVRLRASLEETEPERRGNSSSALVAPDEMALRFADHPEAVAETRRLAERLGFDLTRNLGYRYPGSEDPEADRTLAEICRARLEHRYAGTPHRREAERRLEEELRVIRSLGMSGFFLLHFDLLELAREVATEVRGPDTARALLPPGRGRGSSVSSVVCYLTGLSHVDPVRAGLFLGRFLNDEISEMPDIDLDFPRDVREKLIPRVHERYGHDRAALVAAFATYRSRGAVRDLGKALGLPPGEIERVAGMADMYARPDEVERDIAEAIGVGRARSERWRALARLAREAWGLPRHVSQHPGGMVLSTQPLIDVCPVQPAAMEGRQLVQWDKDSCSDAGFLKIDLLGLGMLSAVERCVDQIARARGERVDLSRVPLDDSEVWERIRSAETTGTFQIESRAQMQMLPRSRPECLDDLIVQVALVRPGPIQGGAVHPYLERKRLLREDSSYEIPYEHPCLEPILRDTLGAIVFQDQVIQVAMALAGFSAGEAEGLRRAMSRKRSEAALRAYRERFVAGAVEQGTEQAVAERVYEQVEGFSGFGFPKSHAAAFALLGYQSMWLRVHYGAEFLCSLLNEQPMGFYPADSLVHEAQRRGIEVLGADVNQSGVECSVEPVDGSLGVRIGLGYVKGLAEEEVRVLVAERERGGPYADLGELASRSGMGRDGLMRLAWAGACGEVRRDQLWRLGVTRGAERMRGRVHAQLSLPLGLPPAPELRPLDSWERIVADYESTQITLGEHPMQLMRAELGESVTTSADLAGLSHGSQVTVAGLVVARQRPATARGIVFMLFEDEFGVVNLIVPPPVYERCRLAVRTASLARARGRFERREGVTNVVADSVERLQAPGGRLAQVRPIEPAVERETGRDGAVIGPDGAEEAWDGTEEVAAVAPRAHSFGRRG